VPASSFSICALIFLFRQHQTEQERLKREISQEKRAGAEHAEQLAKAKKQLDAQDARIQELKKAQATGDVELREVRVKLRSAEQERTQLAAKQADAGDARKAAAALDAKRKEELKERDRRVAELERALAAEQRRREDAETRAADARRTADAATHGAKGAQADLQSRLDAAVADATEARAALEGADEAREELVDRVSAFSDMLARAAEQYGRLATVTVSAATHARLKAEHAALELREFKLARKLANTEDQVQELAHLIRQTKDQNALLAAQLRDADTFASSSSSALRAYLQDGHDVDAATELAALAAEVDILQARADAREAGLLCEAAASSQWQHHAQDLLGAYTDAELAVQQHSRELAARGKALAEAVAGREKLSAEVARAQVERDEAKGQLAAATSAADRARAAELAAQHEVEATVRARKTDAAAHGDALQKEKDATRRAANAAQKNKLAEEALQTEVEQYVSAFLFISYYGSLTALIRLTAELMDAMQYQDAYRELTEQVSITIARSNLAEEEVEKLSRFNAEILGHRNASQKIMYVERIRRELAETKQVCLLLSAKICLLTRDAIATPLGHERSRRRTDRQPGPALGARHVQVRVGRPPAHGLHSGHSRATRDPKSERRDIDSSHG
jgi:chromosome segregation ATPase